MDDSQKKERDILLPGSILVAAFLIAGALIYNVGAKNTNPPADNNIPVAKGDLSDDDVMLGDPSAPVTVVEFGDYQCPFCGKFFSDNAAKLREEYIKSGKVKMVYRDFPFLGQESHRASEASQCAAEQKNFWNYHDQLYITEINDGRENNGNLTDSLLKTIASKIGLDSAKFEVCLSSGRYAKEIEKDYNDGLAAGVRGTPTSFVNGKPLSGYVPYDVLKSAIEEALAAQK